MFFLVSCLCHHFAHLKDLRQFISLSSGSPPTREARAWAEPHTKANVAIYPSEKIWKSRDRTPDRPFAPQRNQCLLSHFLASLEAQEKTNCTSMLWSIDTCQNSVSADEYHLTVPRAQVLTHRGQVFFEVIRWQLPVPNDRRLFFPMIHTKYVVFMSPWPGTVKILISN